MPKTGWIKEDTAKQYWGAKRQRIDLTRDENGNWEDAEGVRYTTFDASRVPLLLIRFIPVCPECDETAYMGFLNWEKDPEGKGGYAFRHIYHFWYNGVQMWGYPPPVRNLPKQPGVQEEDLGPPMKYPEDDNKLTFHATTSEDERTALLAGKEAFKAGKSRWSNPNDGRTAIGRAWNAGWDVAKTEGEKVESQT